MSTESEHGLGGIRIRRVFYAVVVTAAVFCFLLLYITVETERVYTRSEGDWTAYVRMQQDAYGMQQGSDYLTQQVRIYTVTEDFAFVRLYFEEAEETRRRDRALSAFREGAENEESFLCLEQAMEKSLDLMEREYHAMRLILEASDRMPEDLPDALRTFALPEEEKAMTPEKKRLAARDMVFGEEYRRAKEEISTEVLRCTEILTESARLRKEDSAVRMHRLMRLQQVLIGVLALIVVATVVITTVLVIRPLERNVRNVRASEPMEPAGAFETRFLADVYNRTWEHTRQNREKLTYEVMHDPLTGAFNRRAYESFLAECDEKNIALILADVDCFKQINDTAGHAAGDAVLKRVVTQLQQHFRSDDRVCRIGGDEFAVLMMNATSSLRDLVIRKLEAVGEELLKEQPPVTLSIGIAFGDRENPSDSLMKDADTALYQVKNRGRNGRAVYEG